MDIDDLEVFMTSEEKLQRWMDAFMHSSWGIVIGHPDNKTLKMMNPAFAEMHGYVVGELLDKPIVDVFAPESRGDAEVMIKIANETGRCTYESKHIKKDGTVFPVLIDLTAVRDDENNLLYRIGNVLDITELRKATEERDRFFELSIDMLCIAHTDGYFKRLNPAFKNILGYELEELMSKPYVDFVHPDDVNATVTETKKLSTGIPTIEFQNRYRCKDGTYKWISWHCMPHPSGTIYGVARDVTAEKEIQKTLRQSLKEKEVLLKEIHHRVKNNLQVISSLINMQIRKLDNVTAKNALLECQSRIQAIALIHEKLYQSADYAKISFSEYVKSLMNDIFQATGASSNTIAFELDILKTTLAIDKAIPCALIINELVTNSIKHAFPDNRRGVINIKMQMENGRYTLIVSDNGVGLAEGFHLKETSSLGLQLVSILVDQLKGEIKVQNKSGTQYTIQFDR